MKMEYERLGDGIYVCRSELHSFGTDAFLLEGFAAHKAGDTVCDLGTGCGIIPLLMYRRDPPKKVYALDIQPEAIMQLRLAIGRSTAPLNIEPICADLRKLWVRAPIHELDLVTCNPPYYAQNAGLPPQDSARMVARHEAECDIGDVCAAASRLLRNHGRFCVCGRPERLTDVFAALRANLLEPKRLRFVSKTPQTAPWLFLLEALKSAKPSLRVEPALFLRSGGELSDEAARLCLFGDSGEEEQT